MGKNTYFINKDDEAELARLLVQDNAYHLVLDLLPRQFTPTPGARVLDLACGPGGWALQVGLEYPQLSVTAVDLSEQMIVYARAQAQVREVTTQFRLMDLLKFPWSFPDQHFDLVNARFITSLTPRSALLSFYQECWRILQPGGILRYTEGSFLASPTSPATQQLNLLACEATFQAGLSASPYEMGMASIAARLFKTIGFTDLHLTPSLVDLSYAEPMYRLMKENWLMSISLLKPFLLKMKVATEEKIDQLHQQFTQDWESPDFVGHYHLCSIVARKPQ
jgi:ubiquinone/menaquinone biosynthesis C-methylase UbiE